MKYIKLSNGVQMPILGYGVYQISEKETEASVLAALKTGYRLIDTAHVYGNEEAVGRAIKNSKVAREEIFLTTKLWVENYEYEKAKKAIQESMQRLDVDYIDLFLLHQPYNDIFGAWKALTEFYNAGKIRAIGVSNFYNDRITDLSTWSGIKPMINQIEMNPFYQRKKEIGYQQGYGVILESWAPFAEGRNNIFSNPTLMKIADKYKKSVAQVILRWIIEQGIVVIPKSVTPSRIAENFNVFDFQLSAEDKKAIRSLDLNKTQFFDHDSYEAVLKINNITANK